MSKTEIALVAIVVGISFFGLLAYLRSTQSQPQLQSSAARSEVWEVQSDRQGIPERITIRR